LRLGNHQEAGAGGERRHGAGGTGTTKPVVYNTVEAVKRFWEVLGRNADFTG